MGSGLSATNHDHAPKSPSLSGSRNEVHGSPGGRVSSSKSTNSRMCRSLRFEKDESWDSQTLLLARSMKEENGFSVGGRLDNKHILVLSRGGVYVSTSGGPVQFGCPPETIKDCLAEGLEVPTCFVVPSLLFNRYQGLSMYEFEFPAYYNYFVKGKRVTIWAGDTAVRDRIFRILQETLCGPQKYDLEREFTQKNRHLMPNLSEECKILRDKGLSVDTIVDVKVFVQKQEITFNGMSEIEQRLITIAQLFEGSQVSIEQRLIADDPDAFYLVYDREPDKGDENLPKQNKLLGVKSTSKASQLMGDNDLYDRNLEHPIAVVPVLNGMGLPGSKWKPRRPPQTRYKHFVPPTFGVTVLGASHGFDPTGSTAGFVLWTNGFGTLVDPPPFTMELLRDNFGIPPRTINGVILTHCHADHDCGVFQILLNEGRIKLYTTATILGSFVRKYANVLDCRPSFLLTLCDPAEVYPHIPTFLNGAKLTLFYAWHTIPCVGFTVEFGGKSFVYSADHFNDPDRVRNLCSQDDSIMSNGRRDWLMNFPWDRHDIVFHELGIPPIHTPASILLALPDDVRKKLYVIHVSQDKIPEGLRRAPVGAENTIVLIPKEISVAHGSAGLDSTSNVGIRKQLYLEGIPFLACLTSWQAFRLLQLAEEIEFTAGDVIVENDAIDEHFYIVCSGWVKIQRSQSIARRLRALVNVEPRLEESVEMLMKTIMHSKRKCKRKENEHMRFMSAMQKVLGGVESGASEITRDAWEDSKLVRWLCGSKTYSSTKTKSSKVKQVEKNDGLSMSDKPRSGMRRVSDNGFRLPDEEMHITEHFATAGSYFNERVLLVEVQDKSKDREGACIEGDCGERQHGAFSDQRVVATTDVIALKVNRYAWMPMFHETNPVVKDLQHCVEYLEDLEMFLPLNKLFSTLSQSQCITIASRVERKHFTVGFQIWKPSQPPEFAVMVITGRLSLVSSDGRGVLAKAQANMATKMKVVQSYTANGVIVNSSSLARGGEDTSDEDGPDMIKPGAFVIASDSLWRRKEHHTKSYGLVAHSACDALVLSNDALTEIFSVYPGLLVSILDQVVVI